MFCVSIFITIMYNYTQINPLLYMWVVGMFTRKKTIGRLKHISRAGSSSVNEAGFLLTCCAPIPANSK